MTIHRAILGGARMKGNVIPMDNTIPRDKWVGRICAAWREQLPSIFETGNLLEAAKAELKHGEWGAMFQKGEMPFTRSVATRLMIIAQNDNVRNDAHAHNLPVKWDTLYELTKLTDEQFDNGINSGAINPQMQRKDVKALRGIEPKESKKKAEPAMNVRNLDDWVFEFSSQIKLASTQLSKTENMELAECLKQIVADLEATNV